MARIEQYDPKNTYKRSDKIITVDSEVAPNTEGSNKKQTLQNIKKREIVNKTDDYTITAADGDLHFTFNKATDVNITVSTSSLEIGEEIVIEAIGVGGNVLVEDGVTISGTLTGRAIALFKKTATTFLAKSLTGGGGGGLSQLTDLSDVSSAAPTNGNALMGNGTTFASRPLVEDDISNLDKYTQDEIDTFNSVLSGLISDVEGDVSRKASMAGNFALFTTSDSGANFTATISGDLDGNKPRYLTARFVGAATLNSSSLGNINATGAIPLKDEFGGNLTSESVSSTRTYILVLDTNSNVYRIQGVGTATITPITSLPVGGVVIDGRKKFVLTQSADINLFFASTGHAVGTYELDILIYGDSTNDITRNPYDFPTIDNADFDNTKLNVISCEVVVSSTTELIVTNLTIENRDVTLYPKSYTHSYSPENENYSTGELVSLMTDIKNSVNLTATSTDRPEYRLSEPNLNGQPAIYFNGSNQLNVNSLTLAKNVPSFLFAAPVFFTANTTQNILFNINNSVNGQFTVALNAGGVSGVIRVGARRLNTDSFVFHDFTTPVASGKHYIIAMVDYANGMYYLMVDGVLESGSLTFASGNGNTENINHIAFPVIGSFVGDTIYLTGYVGDVLMYSSLSSGDMTKLNNHFISKYG